MLTDAVVESMRPEIGRADFDSSASVSHWQPTFAVRALAPPATIDGVEPVMGPVPCLGGHTDAILAELGFDQVTIEGWRDVGVV